LSRGLPTARILVIEAGPAAPDDLGINVPGRKGSTLGTRLDWNFTTVPQEGLRGRVVGANRGKVLGGSSALNLLCWDRAATVEYDAWADAGNRGWDWEAMQAAMLRSEQYVGGPPGSGTAGPVRALVNRVVPAHQAAWIPTLDRAFGIPENKDSLNGNPIGASLQPSSIDPAHYNRSYSTNAYLPLAGRNLDVLTDTLVSQVLLRGSGSKGSEMIATGVLLANGTTVSARREVILSAGTFQSPLLLELSGIGQPGLLTSANITPVVPLPGVGENLADHVRVQASYLLPSGATSFDILRHNTSYAAAELAKWLAGDASLYDYTASGFLFANWAQVLGPDGAARLRDRAAAELAGSTHPADRAKLLHLADRRVPQLEVIFSDGYTGVKGYPAPGTPLYGRNFFTLIAGLMHPLARGSVHLNASTVRGRGGGAAAVAKPVIDPRYGASAYDVAALVEAAKFLRRLALAPPLRQAWEAEYEPGPEAVGGGAGDDEWRAFVRNTTLSIFHPTGTCSMLPRADGGVVDARLVVYGTRNLRVVDASVVPVQISAHIQTAVYGIAERAAEIIVREAERRAC